MQPTRKQCSRVESFVECFVSELKQTRQMYKQTCSSTYVKLKALHTAALCGPCRRSGAGQPVFQQSYVFIDVCKDQQGRVQKQMTCQFAETTYEEKFDITDSATREFPFLPVNLQPADPSQPVTGMVCSCCHDHFDSLCNASIDPV